MSVVWRFARLGIASASSRSLFRALRHPRVGLLPLGPLRDGFSVFWLFAFLLVVLFQSAFLLALLVPLTQFGLTSSSSSVGCRCTFSRPLCGIRRPVLRVAVLFRLVFWAGCVALNTHIFPLPLLLPPPLLPPLLSRPLLLSRAGCDALNTQSCSLALFLFSLFPCFRVLFCLFSLSFSFSPFFSFVFFSFFSLSFSLFPFSSRYLVFFLFARLGMACFFFWLFTFASSSRFRSVFALFRVVALVGDPKPGSLVFLVCFRGFPTWGLSVFFCFRLLCFVFCWGLRPHGGVCVPSSRFTDLPWNQPLDLAAGCNQEPRPTKLPDCTGSRA